MKQKIGVGILVTLVIAWFACNNNKPVEMNNPPSLPPIPLINYGVTGFFLHDTSLFTEGLLMHDGKLYESTGSPEEMSTTRSMIGISNLTTGKFDKKIELDRSKYFGEGIVFLNNKLYQLTYKNKTGFIYDAKTFKRLDSFTYNNTEGWGMTTDGKEIIMSDGTDALTFINPANMQPSRVLHVTENGAAVSYLNELEYINGFIYANLWTTNFIVKINPENGNIISKLDLSSLVNEARAKNPYAEVLNGIAYDSVAKKIYVTGKLWPNIYQLEFAH